MSKKMRIAVLMGGPSVEREVSLVTGKAISENLSKKKYEVFPIEISQRGQFFLDTHYYQQLNSPNSKKKKTNKKYQLIDLQNQPVIKNQKFDLVFIALHGTYGEDGAVQGMLECFNIPYTGSGILASALGMDKEKAADIYRSRGLLTPDYVAFGPKEWRNNQAEIVSHIQNYIGFPAVVKPSNQGSAVGVSIIKNEEDLVKAVTATIKKFPRLMAQKFIRGQEATCGVLEKDDQPFALPPTHILANFNEFYDYTSKYKPGGSTHICPADFPAEVNKQIQDIAIQAHQALGCRGMSRTDIFYGDDGRLWVIETNTIPGMTPTSLLPEAAAKAGIGFSEMLDVIIAASLKN